MFNPRSDRVRDIAKLAGRPARLRRRQFLAEGPQAVREALNAHQARQQQGGAPVVAQLFATAECFDRYPELSAMAQQVQLRLATDEVLAAMGNTVTSQGIIAVCNNIDVSLLEVLRQRPRLLAVFARMRDPGNAGTVLRAADAAGADAVVITGSSVDIYNPKAVRSTAGSLFHLPVVVGQDLAQLAEQLNAQEMAVLAADGHGNCDLDDLQDESARRRLTAAARRQAGPGIAGGSSAGSGAVQPGTAEPSLEAPTAWIFGNEAQGLAESELALADHRVSVPVYGAAESLNLAAAATVCLYASARAQRRGAEVP